MRFVDYKIRTKLMGAFGVLILIAFILSVNTIVTLLFFKKDINSFTGEFLPSLSFRQVLAMKLKWWLLIWKVIT